MVTDLVQSVLDAFVACGAAALPYLGAGVAGSVALAGAYLGVRKAYTFFLLQDQLKNGWRRP